MGQSIFDYPQRVRTLGDKVAELCKEGKFTYLEVAQLSSYIGSITDNAYGKMLDAFQQTVAEYTTRDE